ncbi:Uncharacterised protein [Mycobacteroides abscessus]|nr:Uncharacterised protein [Mycobacteroides abscessus]
MRGNLVVGGDRVVHQLGSLYGPRHGEHRDLAVGLGVGAGADVSGQEVTLEPVERAGQLERRGIIVLRNVLRHNVVRRLRPGRCVRVIRHLPEITGREERHRIVDVIAGQQRPLHLEQILRVAQVALEVIRDISLGLHRSREDLHPCLEHGVLLVLLIQGHRAVIGIHRRLDRVPDVRDLLVGQRSPGPADLAVKSGFRQRRLLRIRVVVQRGIAVDNPHQPLVDDRRIGATVDGEPRSHRFHPTTRVTVEQDLAVIPNHVGEQEVPFGVFKTEDRARQRTANGNTATAGVGAVLGPGIVLVVVLTIIAVLSDDRVVVGVAGDDRAVVDAGLSQRRRAVGEHLAVVVDGVHQELWVTAVLVRLVGHSPDGVGGSRDESVAVGVHGVPVDPVPLVVTKFRRIQLARRDHIVAQRSVLVLIAVDRQRIGEGVEVLTLLQLSKGRADDVRIQHPDIGDRGPVGRDLLGQLLAACGRRGRAAVVAVGHHVIGQTVRVPRRLDAARDVLALLLRRIGFDTELLNDERPPGTDHQR